MKENELITIGIPSFNAEDSILRALNSAAGQTWKNKEILVVDDASIDQTVAIINRFIKQHSNVRLVQHETNKGSAQSRQTILDNALGDFIVFFDDDDESLPERLERQYECISQYERKNQIELIACYASGTRIYSNGYEKHFKAIGSLPKIPFGPSVADYLLFYGGSKEYFYGAGTPTCSLMARKKTFDKVGGFDPNFRRVEDIDFAIRLALAGGHFIGCSDNLIIQHATESADKSNEKNRDAEIQLAEKHKQYLKTRNRYYYAIKWPLLRYFHFKKQYINFLLTMFLLFIRYPIKTITHLLSTVPKRMVHESKMK